MAALGPSCPEPVMLRQEGSAEQYLLNECGIEKSKVDGVIKAAVAWRVTAAGRELVDRRRRSRVERNLISCAEYLVEECGIEPGKLCAHSTAWALYINKHDIMCRLQDLQMLFICAWMHTYWLSGVFVVACTSCMYVQV